MRTLSVSDIHGSVKCFRKLVNAGTFCGADLMIIERARSGVVGAPLAGEASGPGRSTA